MTETTYNPTPVPGYQEGLIISESRPERITIEGNPNDWFVIGDRRYNVHPYRSDLGGYPVRWSEALTMAAFMADHNAKEI